MGEFVWVGLWVELLSLETKDATPYSYSNPAEYFSMIYSEHYSTRTAVGRR